MYFTGQLRENLAFFPSKSEDAFCISVLPDRSESSLLDI